jgi:hypothetical protein
MPRSFGDFARPTYAEPRWMETQWFSAVTKDSMIRLHIWVGFRTNLGVATSKVYAFSTMCDEMLDMDLNDMQYHQPIGSQRLGDFSLVGGVSSKAHPAPDRYTVGYRSRSGRMTARLELTALMPPVDLAYTAIAGARAGFTAFHKKNDPDAPDIRAGEEPVGHIDQTMRVTGTIVLDGQTHEVDCVSNRDHSWSPRAEFYHRIGTFDLFHFGEELTLLTHTGETESGEPFVTNGYLLEEGRVQRLTEAHVRYEKEGRRTRRVEYRVTGEDGAVREITGTARASAEIDGGQNILLVMDLFDAAWDGRTGYGEIQWHDDIMRVQGVRRRARLGL